MKLFKHLVTDLSVDPAQIVPYTCLTTLLRDTLPPLADDAAVFGLVMRLGEWSNLKDLRKAFEYGEGPQLGKFNSKSEQITNTSPDRDTHYYTTLMSALYIGFPSGPGFVLVKQSTLIPFLNGPEKAKTQLAMLMAVLEGLIYYGWWVKNGRTFSAYDKDMRAKAGTTSLLLRAQEYLIRALTLSF